MLGVKLKKYQPGSGREAVALCCTGRCRQEGIESVRHHRFQNSQKKLSRVFWPIHILHYPEIKKKKKKALVTSHITEMNSLRSLAWFFGCVKEKIIWLHFLNKILGQKYKQRQKKMRFVSSALPIWIRRLYSLTLQKPYLVKLFSISLVFAVYLQSKTFQVCF